MTLIEFPKVINPLNNKIMNIFNALRVYAGKWSEKEVRNFTEEEVAAVQQAKVVESQYGFSVCFMMVGGGMAYVPLDQNSSASEGDIINLSAAKLVTLSKVGENDIYRVRP